MNYKAMYDGIIELQSELRFEIQSYTLLSEVDYRLVKALAASYELQDYLANKLAEEPDQEWWAYAMAHVAQMEGANAAALNEQLKADPDAEVPEHIKQHVMEMLGGDLRFYEGSNTAASSGRGAK